MKSLAFSLKAEIFYPISKSKYFFVVVVKRLSKKNFLFIPKKKVPELVNGNKKSKFIVCMKTLVQQST